MEVEPMQLCSHACQQGKRHGSRAGAPKDDDDVAQHGGHTPNNTKSYSLA